MDLIMIHERSVYMSNLDNKKDIKYQLYVTSKMDDKVQFIAESMGLSKSEVIRYFIAQGCMGFDQSISLIRDNADKIIDKAVK